MKRAKQKRAYGQLGPLLVARVIQAGDGRCIICLRALALDRKHNRRICGRATCLRLYKRLHKADNAQPSGLVAVVSVEPGSTAGRVVERLACGHRLVQWLRWESKTGERRCEQCREGVRKNAKPLDVTLRRRGY